MGNGEDSAHGHMDFGSSLLLSVFFFTCDERVADGGGHQTAAAADVGFAIGIVSVSPVTSVIRAQVRHFS